MDFGMPMNLSAGSNKYGNMGSQQQNFKKRPFPSQNLANNNVFPPQPLQKKPPKVFQDFYKTQMCPQLPLGTCYKGDHCSYAHSEQELRKKPDLSKTKLCEAFMKGGTCINGDKCQFAHGSYELKSTPDFYKTALCFSFKNSGICQAGDKCRYAHGDEELKMRANMNMSSGMPAPSFQMPKQQKPYDYYMMNKGADANSIDNYFPQMYPNSQMQMMPNYMNPMNPAPQPNMKNNMNMGGMMLGEANDFGFNSTGMGMGAMQGPGNLPSFEGFKQYNAYTYDDKK